MLARVNVIPCNTWTTGKGSTVGVKDYKDAMIEDLVHQQCFRAKCQNEMKPHLIVVVYNNTFATGA